MEIIFQHKILDKAISSITDEGYAVYKDVNIARTGIQEYLAIELGDAFSAREPADIIRVYRPAEEVFDAVSMQSFENKPITNDHPTVPVTVSNHKDLAVGNANNIKQSGNFLQADLMITNPDVIADIKSGKRELSNGYTSSLELKAGISPEGEKYDAIQRTIRGNHIAVVSASRCGANCSLSDTKPKPLTREEKTMRILINGIPFEVQDEALAAAITAVTKQNADLTADADSLKTQHADAVSQLQATHDTAMASVQAQLDEANNNAITPEKLDALLESRMEVIADAKVLVPEIEIKGKTCMQLKREVLTQKFGDSIAPANLENDVYVNARFDAAKDAHKANGTSTLDRAMGGSSVTQPNQTTDASVIAFRKRQIGNSIAHQFSAKEVSTRARTFTDAIDKQYEIQYGTSK